MLWFVWVKSLGLNDVLLFSVLVMESVFVIWLWVVLSGSVMSGIDWCLIVGLLWV